MTKKLTESLREYSQIIAEADQDWEEDTGWKEPTDNEDDPAQTNFLPDSSEDLSEIGGNIDENDPIAELSEAIATATHGNNQEIEQAIIAYLTKNNYEIIPVGGLVDKQGAL